MSNVLYQTVISRQGGGAGCWRARVGAECWIEGSNRDTDVHFHHSHFKYLLSIVSGRRINKLSPPKNGTLVPNDLH